MKKKIMIFSILMVIGLLPNLKSQTIPKEEPNHTYMSKNGWFLPVHNEIRVLVVFFEVNWDIGNDPDPNGTTLWPKNNLPIWKNSLFDANYPGYGNETGIITKYFSKASFGDYQVLGDYLVNPNNNGCFVINRSALMNIEAPAYSLALANVINANMSTLQTAHNLNNISYFDKYWLNGSHFYGALPPSPTNRKYDNIIFILRNSGSGAQGFSIENDQGADLLGNRFDSFSVFGTNMGNIPTNVCRHEYAHFLLGDNNFHAGGGGYGDDGQYFIPIEGGYSLLGLYNSSLLTWNAWDRERLDWKPAGNVFNPSARNENNTSEVDGSIDGANSINSVYWLRDFVKTGDAIKIKLPFIPANSQQEYLWIENHNANKVENNYSEFDQFIWQDDYPCVEDAAYGLYMYVQVDRDIRVSDHSSYLIDGYADYLKPISADGNFDCSIENTTVTDQCISGSPVNAFTKNLTNPFTGNSDLDLIASDNGAGEGTFNDNIISEGEGTFPYVEKIGGFYYHKTFFHGNTRNAFTINGNKKIGVGTNPSSSNVLTLARLGNSPVTNPYKPNVRKIYLNGVSVEILEQTSSGDIKVRVRTDDIDITNDVRWCANEILTSPVLTSTGYSLNLKADKTITLDQGKTATKISEPNMINGQKIFASPTIFRVMPNTFFNMEENSTLMVDNGSTVYLESNSRLDMGVGAQIIIKNGSKMYMNSTSVINADANAKIIVEPTGQLIIDDALITSKNANTFWQGIEVIGDCQSPQTQQYQGYVEITNGGTIESAVIGIRCKQTMCIPSDNNEYYSGGIINANGAIFKNNKTAISIEPFKPNTTYNSIIENCTFEYPNTVDPNSETEIKYILLSGTKGINIYGNYFIGNPNNPLSMRGNGIETHDASFKLDYTIRPNAFSDLTYGIASYNTNTNNYPEINNTNFTNNLRAIYLSGINGAHVLNCNFEYKSLSSDPLSKAYGIYLDNCNNYHVEGNILSASDMNNKPENGIVINNSGTEYNQIYRNTFNSIKYPLNAQNTNRSSDGYNGLEILCNTIYDGVSNDIVATTETGGDTKGIRILQGDHLNTPKRPAGNLFTCNGNNTYVNYANSSGNMFNYARYNQVTAINYQSVDYYVTPRLSPYKPRITLQNTNIDWTESRWNYDCQNLTGGSEGGKSLSGIDSLKIKINLLQPRIDSANSALMQKIDNGNTIALKNRIVSCQPNGYGKLYSDLRKYSPYLSEEVLLAIIEKQDFQRNLLVNLMLVNTHVAKSYNIMQALNALQPPLTTEQLNQIQSKEQVFSEMELEKIKLSNLVVQRDYAFNRVENFYAHDSLPSSYDSLGLMLERDPRIAAKYQLVYHYLSKKDSLKADLLAGQIPQLFVLNAKEQKEYNNYKQLYDLKRTLQRAGKSFKDLNTEQKQLLLSVIQQPSLSIGELSDLNALRQVDEIVVGKMGITRGGKGLSFNYDEPILDPIPIKENVFENTITDNKNALLTEKIMDETLMSENNIKLYPNPAVDEVNIYYNIASDIKNASIEIFDVTGVNVSETFLKTNSNLVKINTQNLKKGIYYVVLIIDGNKQKVEKLVIQ